MIMEAVIPRKESVQGGFAPPLAGADPPAREAREASRAEQEKKPQAQSQVKIHGEELLKDMLEVVKDHTSMRDVGFKYGIHQGTGRMTVTVVDKETNEVIREIPPERLLDLVDKMEEMVGMLFDAKA